MKFTNKRIRIELILKDMKIRGLIILFIITVIGCREEIILDSNYNSQLLVVDGSITNKPGPYKISLSITSIVRDPQNIPFTGCTVIIHEDSGSSEVLTELEPGNYYTSASGTQGKIGFSYRISILTSDGKEYESDFCEMKEPIEIDSLYVDTTNVARQGYVFGLPGYQFYTNSKTAQTPDNYFLWQITETYKYNANNRLHALYKYGKIYVQNIDTVLGYDTLKTCWKTEKVKNIFTGKTSNLSVPKITNQPLHFVGTDSKRLGERYSFLLEQLTIDEETYTFWQKIQEQISQENILLAKQPYNILGNIRNVNDQSETVLGYFTVASVDQKRMYINKINKPFYFSTCDIGTDLSNMFKVAGPIYLVLTEEGLGKVHPDCIDCRSEGGDIKKPSFWID